MKFRLIALLLCGALVLSAGVVPVRAAAGVGGFYSLGTAQGIEIVPLTASGEAAAGVWLDLDGAPGAELFYPGSQALRVTVYDTAPGRYYLLTVASPDSLVYVNQQTGGGTLTFLAAFTLPTEPTALTLTLTSNQAGFDQRTVSLAYTPWAAVPGLEDGYLDCSRTGDCPLGAFSDLNPAAWYHDGIHWALDNEVLVGLGDGRFGPGVPVTRAMLVTMLYALDGRPAAQGTLSFQDVPPGKWYTEAVRWAASLGIVAGYSPQRFGPGDSLTREQLVTVLASYARYKGCAVLGDAEALAGYADAGQISGWAVNAFRWGVRAGILSGTSPTTLSPRKTASRAEVALMLLRLNQLLYS